MTCTRPCRRAAPDSGRRGRGRRQWRHGGGRGRPGGAYVRGSRCGGHQGPRVVDPEAGRGCRRQLRGDMVEARAEKLEHDNGVRRRGGATQALLLMLVLR